MSLSEIWGIASSWIAGIALVATLLASIASIIKHQSTAVDWWWERHKRKSQLNRLATVADRLERAVQEHEDQAHQMQELSGQIQEMATTLCKHEEDIAQSKHERLPMCRGLIALLDWAIHQGANGEAHKARDQLVDWIHERAHDE